MNSKEFKNTICRVCLDKDVFLDWNNTLVEYSDMTFKDCYYKYTQIKRLDAEPFSSMLCLNCSNGLVDMHTLILKALDSNKFLLDCMSSEIDDLFIVEDNDNDKTDTESEIPDQFENESLGDFLRNSSQETNTAFTSASTGKTDGENEEDTIVQMNFHENFELESNNEESNIEKSFQLDLPKDNISQSMNILSKKSNIITANKKKLRKEYVNSEDGNINKKLQTAAKRTRHKKEEKIDEVESKPVKNSNADIKTANKRKKYVQKQTPSMCSFCSKILHSKYSLQKHEKTHIVNRERKETCPICGLKYFSQQHLKLHMQIHNENRVKNHKCEFCGKEFYEKGALNVHRRVHLGQMIPCSLCSKEFYRQVDLDIHMNSHSASLINVVTKKRSRYCVRCKYCNKNIMSTSFKSHTAAHLKEPLMKCSICNKEFFFRSSCTLHLKSIHGKTTEEYNDFIVVYKKNRLSHLYLEQKADIQVNEDHED